MKSTTPIADARKRARPAGLPGEPRILTLAQLLSTRLPRSVPRVWPLLDSGESCLLWGGTGTGKSFIAMTLALGVAGGGAALGWEFPNTCRVLYVDGEQSMRDLKERFGLLGSALGAGHNPALAAKNLLTYARTHSDAGSPFFDLSDPSKAGEFIAYLKAQDIGFVVFDNLSTLSDLLKDENDAAAFKPMQSLFAHLKKENIAAVLVHHSGKSPGARFRGSSNIGTTFERIVALHHNDKEPNTVLAARAEVEKYRSKPPPGFSPQVHFRLVTEENKKGKPQSALWVIDENQSQMAEAWRMFRDGEFSSVSEFVAAFNRRFTAERQAKNFARDFCKHWVIALRIPAQEINQIRGFMRKGRRGDY